MPLLRLPIQLPWGLVPPGGGGGYVVPDLLHDAANNTVAKPSIAKNKLFFMFVVLRKFKFGFKKKFKMQIHSTDAFHILNKGCCINRAGHYTFI